MTCFDCGLRRYGSEMVSISGVGRKHERGRAHAICASCAWDRHLQRQTCSVCHESGAPMYALPGGLVCGDCIDRAVDARKEALV